MAALGGLAIGLSIVLGGFVLVLLAELYYLFYWKCRSSRTRRITNVVTKSTEGGPFKFTRKGLVGSLCSQSIREASDPDISATLAPISPGVIGSNDSLYMQGVLGGPRVLFTIKEETKEDMEYEESVGEHKIMFSDSEQRLSNSHCPSLSKSPSKNNIRERCYHQLQKQWRDLYSIGLLPQQQKMQESRCYWKPSSPSPQPMNLSDLLSQPFSFSSSPPLVPGRFVSLSSPRSSPWRSNHTLSASARNESLKPYRKRQSFFAITSNPIYDTDKMPSLPTLLGTAVSPPCGLDTPPLTPMSAPLPADSIPLSTSAMSRVSFLTNPAVNSD
uniref:Uncharacterized protein n=1 Tax=Picea sitchensis TaxID=3332 RepID=D5ACP0_PICSI|nr:unknown [Picea sitchensis]